MPFYTDRQRKEFNSGFFKFVDGSTVKLKVKNVSEERFSDGKTELLLNITNVETGEFWEKVKFQFAFANKLDTVAEYKDENTVIEVKPKLMGMEKSKKDPTKEYEKWDFIITVVGQDEPASAPVATDDPGF